MLSDTQLIQNAFRCMPEAVFIMNTDLVYIAASQQYAELRGFPDAESILGKTDLEVLRDPVRAANYQETDRLLLATGDNLLDSRQELSDHGNRILYRSVSKYVIRDAQGNPSGILGKVVDVTKEMIAEHRYSQEIKNFFQMAEEDGYRALIDLSAWSIMEQKVNPALMQNMPPLSQDLDVVLGNLRYGVMSGDQDARDFYGRFSLHYFTKLYRMGRDYFSYKYFHQISKDLSLWMKDSLWIRIDPHTGHLMLLLRIESIEEKRRKELELHRAAECDDLTGLLNRNIAKARVQDVIDSADLTQPYALFMVDVDDFKHVNDTYGHQAGDHVLKRIADILKEQFRETDIVCRLGGDEFYAFVPITGEKSATKERAENIIRLVCQEPVDGVKITVSIGICQYPMDGETLETLYTRADQAMYHAKKSGKNKYYLYRK